MTDKDLANCVNTPEYKKAEQENKWNICYNGHSTTKSIFMNKEALKKFITKIDYIKKDADYLLDSLSKVDTVKYTTENKLKDKVFEVISDYSEPDWSKEKNNGEIRHIVDNAFDDLAKSIVDNIAEFINLQTYSSIEQWIEEEVKNGYIKEDGTPIKCHCGGEELEQKITDTIEGHVCEYDMGCIKCGKVCGTWSYGNWIL